MSWGTVGTIVGAVIGSVVPGLGTAAGAAIGGAIGGQIDLAQVPTSRLEDRDAQRVNFGAPIPLLFGHPRSGGNIIWCSEAIPSGKVGGTKGGDGGGQETYIRHLIVLHGEGATGPIVRTWSAGKMVRNLRADADDVTVEASVSESVIRECIYHDGAADQQPFSVYATFVGDEFAIAYRGRATSFLTVDCGTSGQLQPLTHEFAGSDAEIDLSTKKILGDFGQSDYLFQPPPGAFYSGSPFALCSIQGGDVATHYQGGDVITDSIPSVAIKSAPGQGNGDSGLYVFGLAALQAGFAWAGGGRSGAIYLPNSGHRIGSSEIRFSVQGERIAVGTIAEIGEFAGEPYGAPGNPGFVYVYNFNGSLEHTYSVGEKVYALALFSDRLYIQDTEGTIHFATDGTIADWFEVPESGTGWRIFPGMDGVLYACDDEANVYKWQVAEWSFVVQQVVDDVDLGTTNCMHGASRTGDIFAVEMYPKTVEGTYYRWFWSWEDNVFYPSLEAAIGATSDPVWVVYQQYGPDGAIRPRRNPTVSDPVISSYSPPAFPLQAFVSFGIEVWYFPNELVDEPDGVWEAYPGPPETYYQRRFDGPYEVNLHNVYRTRVTPLYDLTEPTLQEVVEALCYRAGLDPDVVDATDLATKYVHAFAVTQVGATSAALELLMAVYRFYCVESQGVLVFKFIGGDSVRTIPYGDLGATFGEAPANPLPMVRGQIEELPSMESVRYSNISNDYQDGLESSDRLLQSLQSARTVDYAIGLYPDEAKQLAVVTQQVGQTSLIRVGPFSLGPDHRDLELGEPITVTTQDGSLVQILPSKSRYDRGILTLEGASYDAAAYESDALTSNNYSEALTVRPPASTLYEILDPPLFSDEFDGPSFWVAAKPSRTPWPGYSFLRSTDNTTYSEVYQDDETAVYGSCTSVLPDWSGGYVVDWQNTLTVNVGAELSSITRQELMTTRLNACMVGDELLQFQRAELVDSGVYELSGFIRYLGGTEWVTHSSGEKFVLIDTTKLHRVGISFVDFNVSKYYRSVTRGRNIDTGITKQFAPMLVSLKPLAPGNLRAIYLPNGDIKLRWVRRTRYQSDPLRGIVPLGESSEAYTVAFYDGDTPISSYTSTIEEFVYTTSLQAADGIDSGTDLRTAVAQVGQMPGTPAELSLET